MATIRGRTTTGKTTATRNQVAPRSDGRSGGSQTGGVRRTTRSGGKVLRTNVGDIRADFDAGAGPTERAAENVERIRTLGTGPQSEEVERLRGQRGELRTTQIGAAGDIRADLQAGHAARDQTRGAQFNIIDEIARRSQADIPTVAALNIARGERGQTRDQQMDAIARLTGVATGAAPTVAELMEQRQREQVARGIRQQLASARGGFDPNLQASAARAQSEAQADIGQQTAIQAAAERRQAAIDAARELGVVGQQDLTAGAHALTEQGLELTEEQIRNAAAEAAARNLNVVGQQDLTAAGQQMTAADAVARNLNTVGAQDITATGQAIGEQGDEKRFVLGREQLGFGHENLGVQDRQFGDLSDQAFRTLMTDREIELLRIQKELEAREQESKRRLIGAGIIGTTTAFAGAAPALIRPGG
jgi:hypothetical protein